MTQKIGTEAPDFSLKDRYGKSHSLDNVKSKYTVVYFYPKDNTPGCALEATMFNKDLDRFRELGTEIIGISGGDEASKTEFCEKHKLTLTLLSDNDFSVSRKYGVYDEKSFMGHKYLGISRTTFVLDKDRDIIKVFENVNPVMHSKDVMSFLKKHGSE
jgi:peroxiredoxin Q/BCP